MVIGGMAGFLQGSPLPTVDVDITPEQAPDNFARLSSALKEMEAKVRVDGQDPLPFAHDAQTLAAAQVWDLTTRYGDLDISLVLAGTRGYDDLRRDAVEVDIRGTRVLLASLADVVRSKGAANRDKDRRALPVLRELLARETRARAAKAPRAAGGAPIGSGRSRGPA